MTLETRWEAWQHRVRANYIGLEFRPIGDYGGYCDYATITINPELSVEQQMNICVHELGHWFLHMGPQLQIVESELIRPILTSQQQEFEAQLVVRLFHTIVGKRIHLPYPSTFHSLTYDEAIDLYRAKPFDYHHRRSSLAVEKIIKLLEP